jgi:hypothetical protein
MPKKLNEKSRQKAIRKRFNFLIYKAHLTCGDNFTLDDVENCDEWLAKIDFSPKQRGSFIGYTVKYLKHEGGMFPIFELEATKYFNPYKLAAIGYCAEILVDEILKFNHKHFK